MRPVARHRPSALARGSSARGFTLVELMITLVVLALVVVVLTAVMFAAQRGKVQSANNVESSQAARVALDLMARDLRSAGYGADLDDPANPQPAIAYVDSMQVLISEDLNPYPDTLSAVRGMPQAYDPAATPRPFPLNGTSWTPPKKFMTGAELVRWTLDVNNDGQVDSGDQLDPNGADARRTKNPDDFELVRQVYGDSTNATKGNNGGNTERVALVRRPGNGVPPMFQVYLSGSTTPWDWSSGPVPASQLGKISRVTLQVTGESARPDWRGQYSRTVYRTDVSSMRNVPVFSSQQYTVDGYVFNDSLQNGRRDVGETGVANAQVILGSISTTTGPSGYFLLQAPAGTYTLRHVPPLNFLSTSSPDTFVITLGPSTSRSFADIRRNGGTLHVRTFDDLNNNGTQDIGEGGHSAVKVNVSGTVLYTPASGDTTVFLPVGGYTVTCTAPDSFIVTTTNPVSGTMANGGSASVSFGVYKAPTGTVTGTVYRDINNNGSKDGAEPGLANVWVGVSDDGGSHIVGFAYTDASGNYSVTVPANDPPKTTPYSVFVLPPTGYFATSAAAINNVWVKGGQTASGLNFGLNSFTRIQLNATRVLCLASSDMGEQDWNGNHTENRVRDVDLALGADAGGTDQVSVWFNQYNRSPVFNPTPDYTRTAPNAVLSLALDTLETSDAFRRPDMVTGTKAAAAGNFFVWLNQNTSGNYGIFPTTYQAGMNYKTQDNGDVTSVLTYDCAGGTGPDLPDLIVGTKGATAGQGSIEIWRSNNSNPVPTFTRDEIYPTAGGLAAGSLGEVTSMALADFDGDGYRDLVVTTRRSDFQGQLLFFKFVNKGSTPHFQLQVTWFFGSDIPMVVTPVDVDKDGHPDVIVGTQSSSNSGGLYYLRNATPSLFSFGFVRRVDAPGIVQSMVAADLGGTSGSDLAVGYRSNTSSYAGGVRIYYLDLGNLPSNGVDPSGGQLTNWTPALTVGNYNYGVYPSTPPAPYLMDLCAGAKIDASTGALWVFIR